MSPRDLDKPRKRKERQFLESHHIRVCHSNSDTCFDGKSHMTCHGLLLLEQTNQGICPERICIIERKVGATESSRSTCNSQVGASASSAEQSGWGLQSRETLRWQKGRPRRTQAMGQMQGSRLGLLSLLCGAVMTSLGTPRPTGTTQKKNSHRGEQPSQGALASSGQRTTHRLILSRV